MSMFKRGDDGVRGTAHVVSVSRSDGIPGWGRAWMRLVVQVPGRPAFQVEYDEVIKKTQWPWPDADLPVVVAARRPELLEILWDEVPTSGERAAADAQAMVDRLNTGTPAEPPPAGAVPGFGGFPGGMAGVHFVNMRDPGAAAQFGSMIEMAEQMTGRDLNGDGRIGPGPVPPGGGAAPPQTGPMPPGAAQEPPEPQDTVPPEYQAQAVASTPGGTVAELERLSALYSAGSLTQAEFEAAKHRILGID